MASPVLVGREATHGTLATAFSSVGNFTAKSAQKNVVREEMRGTQDVHFNGATGRKWETWSIAEGFVYDDVIGLFLASAMGAPVVAPVAGDLTVSDNEFKFADDPASLSFQWAQFRRAVQGYQSTYGVVDKLTLKFSADGDLLWSAEGIAKAETEIATPTYAFSTAKPFNGWEVVAKVGGVANTRLVDGSIVIARNRAPRPLLDGTQDVGIAIGNRTVEWDLSIDFDVKTEYDKFKAGATDSLQLTWTQNGVTIGDASHPQFGVRLGSIYYETGEIDDTALLPILKAKGKATYNGDDASLMVATLRSLTDFSD
jgi:hypothetical protein